MLRVGSIDLPNPGWRPTSLSAVGVVPPVPDEAVHVRPRVRLPSLLVCANALITFQYTTDLILALLISYVKISVVVVFCIMDMDWFVTIFICALFY